MEFKIETYTPDDLDCVLRLSLRAWAPVFSSLKEVLGSAVFEELYPHWPLTQAETIEATCLAKQDSTWVAKHPDSGAVVGFVVLKLNEENNVGEIYMLAVDPKHQGQGIGTALTHFALDIMKSRGMKTAMVETGGDPGHEPARATYEKAGFTVLPIARYFKRL
ncbi:MAG: GNAT family N-acetyltransferase [Firmicutes bacterium]|nr:GNAT family N-acetyltransferase [Bacillota bacterium]